MSTSPIHCEYLLRAGLVLTQNSQREILEDCAIVVDKGSILAMGSYADLARSHAPGREIDLRRCLVMPGLINGHTHSPMTLFRGFSDDLPLMDWLHAIFPVEAKLTPELIHVGALLACAEMVRTGTTCFNDGYLRMEQVGEAAEAIGIRAVLAEGFFKFPSPMFPTAQDAWTAMARLRERFADSPLVDTAFFPHAIYTTDPESLVASFELAEAHDCVWQIHCSETPAETAMVLKEFGKRPLAYLDGLGLLTNRAILHHMVDVTDEEVDLVAQRDAVVVHNPESNMKLASGAAPIQRFLDAGTRVALGTDGAASNNDLNMFTEMASAAFLQKVRLLDASALPAQAVLDMATLGGAQAVRKPGLGQLAPGAPADLCALDMTSPNLQPMHDPIATAVYSASGHETVLTMVNGAIAYENGAFPGIDYPALLKEVRLARDWMRKQRG